MTTEGAALVTDELWTGAWVREARQKAGLQIKELAERSGVSASSITDVEADRVKSPGIIFLRQLAAGLELPLGVLLHERGGGESYDLGYQTAIIDVQDELAKLRRAQRENSAA